MGARRLNRVDEHLYRVIRLNVHFTRDGRYPNFGQAVIAANYFAIFAIIAIFLNL